MDLEADMVGVRDRLRRVSGEARSLIAVFSGIATVAFVVVFVTWSEALKGEAGKTALSVLAVAVFGGLATLTVSIYQQRRKDDTDIRLRASQAAVDEGNRREENWRRELERKRDLRGREDELVRSLLQETLRTYNSVKRARRLLKAYTSGEGARHVRIGVSDSFMEKLIDDQLTFEELKRMASVGGRDRLRLTMIAERYSIIEKYLNEIVGEYENDRHRVEAAGDLPLAELRRLSAFFRYHYFVDAGDGSKEDIGFEANVSHQIDEIIRHVQSLIVAPIDLQDVSAAVECDTNTT